MFRRLIFDHTAVFFTVSAFIIAASIYLAFFWRAIRMKPSQVTRFAQLPFETETPASRHDA